MIITEIDTDGSGTVDFDGMLFTQINIRKLLMLRRMVHDIFCLELDSSQFIELLTSNNSPQIIWYFSKCNVKPNYSSFLTEN